MKSVSMKFYHENLDGTDTLVLHNKRAIEAIKDYLTSNEAEGRRSTPEETEHVKDMFDRQMLWMKFKTAVKAYASSMADTNEQVRDVRRLTVYVNSHEFQEKMKGFFVNAVQMDAEFVKVSLTRHAKSGKLMRISFTADVRKNSVWFLDIEFDDIRKSAHDRGFLPG